jgi:hypothetical protein
MAAAKSRLSRSFIQKFTRSRVKSMRLHNCHNTVRKPDVQYIVHVHSTHCIHAYIYFDPFGILSPVISCKYLVQMWFSELPSYRYHRQLVPVPTVILVLLRKRSGNGSCTILRFYSSRTFLLFVSSTWFIFFVGIINQCISFSCTFIHLCSFFPY